MSTSTTKFSIGQKVTAQIKHRGGTTTVEGTVTALPPATTRGKCRYTVRDGANKDWKPYESQIAA